MNDNAGLSKSISSLRAREDSVRRNAGGVRRFAVDIPVLGIGESIQQVWFPDLFVEKPLHSWGMELIGGQSIPENATPFATVMIRSWNIETVEDSNVQLYKGCRVAVRTYTPYVSADISAFTRVGFTVFFEGKAIAHPARVD